MLQNLLEKNVRTVLLIVNIFVEWDEAADWNRVDYCFETNWKAAILRWIEDRAKQWSVWEAAMDSQVPAEIQYRLTQAFLWVRALRLKQWNPIPQYSSRWWLHNATITTELVATESSPWEQLAVHESLCIGSNMRGIRGRSCPQSWLWH